MKLLTYRLDGTQAVGVLTGDGKAVLPLPYPDMNTLIETASPSDLRSAADEAESLTDEKAWPFPTYGDLLFSVT